MSDSAVLFVRTSISEFTLEKLDKAKLKNKIDTRETNSFSLYENNVKVRIFFILILKYILFFYFNVKYFICYYILMFMCKNIYEIDYYYSINS